MEKGAPSCHPTRPTSRVRRAPRWLIEDGRNARAHSALDDDTSAYRMHVQREFPISSAASDVCACWAGRAHAVASTATETVVEGVVASHRAARRQQRSPHEITEDCWPGCCRLPARHHCGGASGDQRSGSTTRPRTRVKQTEHRMRRPMLPPR